MADNELTPLLTYFRDAQQGDERFGDFCHRIGVDALRAYADSYFSRADVPAKGN